MAALQLFLCFVFLFIYTCDGTQTESGKYCITRCTQRTKNNGKSYCFYNRSKWENCVPPGGLIKYYTNNGILCNGACQKVDASFEWCFTGDYTHPNANWDRCSSSHGSKHPPKSVLEDYYKRLPRYHTAYTIDDYCRLSSNPGGQQSSSVTRPRRKRQMDPTNNDASKFRRYETESNDIDRIINDLEHDDEYFITATFNEDRSPHKTVTSFEMSADATHQSDVTATIAMRAEIHPVHSRNREPIEDEVKEHLKLFDRESDDEAGHLLANSLGGSVQPFNFAPQSPALNRAAPPANGLVTPPCWFEVEALIRKYLREKGGYVRWALLVGYGQYPASRRPTRFFLSIRFYNKDRKPVDFEGGTARTYDMPNFPNALCKNRAELQGWWERH